MLPLLSSILQIFPLDPYDTPVMVMDLVDSDKAKGVTVPIIDDYVKIINQSCASHGSVVNVDKSTLVKVERNEFYNISKGAFAVVATGETAIYANIILRKGVI